jgi:predicted kinase
VITAAKRRLVLVSGLSGAGKSTLAGPLAAELGFMLLAKDRIKEALHNGLGEPAAGVDLAWSRRLGAASMEMLWALAQDAPAVVLEANFRPDDPRPAARIRDLADQPVEVFCACPLAECRRRYTERSGSRHVVHVDDYHVQHIEDTFAVPARPIGLGTVISVDTTADIDIPALAREVRTWLP